MKNAIIRRATQLGPKVGKPWAKRRGPKILAKRSSATLAERLRQNLENRPKN